MDEQTNRRGGLTRKHTRNESNRRQRFEEHFCGFPMDALKGDNPLHFYTFFS